jgi:hypothetical protein
MEGPDPRPQAWDRARFDFKAHLESRAIKHPFYQKIAQRSFFNWVEVYEMVEGVSETLPPENKRNAVRICTHQGTSATVEKWHQRGEDAARDATNYHLGMCSRMKAPIVNNTLTSDYKFTREVKVSDVRPDADRQKQVPQHLFRSDFTRASIDTSDLPSKKNAKATWTLYSPGPDWHSLVAENAFVRLSAERNDWSLGD